MELKEEEGDQVKEKLIPEVASTKVVKTKEEKERKGLITEKETEIKIEKGEEEETETGIEREKGKEPEVEIDIEKEIKHDIKVSINNIIFNLTDNMRFIARESNKTSRKESIFIKEGRYFMLSQPAFACAMITFYPRSCILATKGAAFLLGLVTIANYISIIYSFPWNIRRSIFGAVYFPSLEC